MSWDERHAVALLLLGTAALAWLGGPLPLAAQLGLGAGLVALVAVLTRRRGLSLLGPVFSYELLRMARRRRYFLFRTLYVVALLGLLSWIFFIWTVERRYHRGPWRIAEQALFASSFFYAFMVIQYAIVVLLAPLYTAGTIAEEKDRKTMEFVLATDLRDHEIVLGKWLARLGNLMLLVLAGLPVLGFLQFLGGIDPALVVAGFVVAGLTALSLGALGMLCSVFARKPRDAILLTYALAVLYHVVSGASWLVFVPLTGRRGDPALADLLEFLPWTDIVSAFNAGNIGSALVRLVMAFERGGRIDDVVPVYLRQFVVFHALAVGVCLAWAVLRLRAIALRQATAPARPRRRWGWRKGEPQSLPPVGARPVLWKEMYAERGFPRHWLFRIGLILVVLGSFVPVGFLAYHDLVYWPSVAGRYRFAPSGTPWERFGRDMNVWVRVIGTGVSCLLLLAVAVRAAGSVSGERDRHTFDGLITTPLDSDALLFGKWLGSILSVRWGWLWLGMIWGAGLASGGLHPLGALLLVPTWLIYAAVFAAVGVWFSAICKTTLRATVSTLLTVVALAGGHWLVMGLFCYLPLDMMRVRDRDMEWLLFLELGQTPPAVLGFEALHTRDLFHLGAGRREYVYLAVCLPLGVATWAGLAGFLWRVVSRRFRTVVGLAPLLDRRAGSGSAGRSGARREGQRPEVLGAPGASATGETSGR